MTDEIRQTEPHPTLSSISAQLFVADVRAACEFYVDKLGFVVDFIYGDPPFYGQVSRDHARLALRHIAQPVFVDGIREREHLLAASITVNTADDIRRLFLGFQTATVHFHQTLRKEPWNAQTFIVVDPDRNLILFAGPAD